jgi:hypothetical protein
VTVGVIELPTCEVLGCCPKVNLLGVPAETLILPLVPLMLAVRVSVLVMVCVPPLVSVNPLVNVCTPLSPAANV